MLYGLLLAASISAFEPSWLLITNSQDRCETKGDWTSVYYEEDYFYLDYTKRKEIRDFLNKYPNRKKFIVTGYTDGCGSHQYNKELSRRRADEVSRYVISIRRDAIVEMRWVGEASGEHTIKARRVDIS
jgi:outer membrane protein OmpA-like peptidoglycan-associated protein